jgi:hypothetical protein
MLLSWLPGRRPIYFADCRLSDMRGLGKGQKGKGSMGHSGSSMGSNAMGVGMGMDQNMGMGMNAMGGDMAQPRDGGQPGPSLGSAHAGDGGRLLLANVPADVSAGDLASYFSQFGELIDVFIQRGENTGFVEFANPEAAEQVLSLRSVLVAQTHVRMYEIYNIYIYYIYI